MIRNTTRRSPDGVLSAYADNSAVMCGHTARRFYPDPVTRVYGALEYRPQRCFKFMTDEVTAARKAADMNPGDVATAMGAIYKLVGNACYGSKTLHSLYNNLCRHHRNFS